jgi:hypothetical protein
MLLAFFRRPSTLVIAALLLLLSASAAVISHQGQRILSLEGALNPQVGLLPSGFAFDPIQVRDLAGKAHSIQFDKPNSKPMVLYILRPDCVWCQRNSQNIAMLASHLKSKYDFIGLSLASEGLEEFIRREDIRFPVYSDIPSSALIRYRLGGTPETIVVYQGKVVKSWAGAYIQDPIKSDVEEFFSVRLPSNTEATVSRN